MNVYDVTAPTEPPSTSTEATWKQGAGAIVYAWLEPQLTDVAPFGVIEPLAPADDVIV